MYALRLQPLSSTHRLRLKLDTVVETNELERYPSLMKMRD